MEDNDLMLELDLQSLTQQDLEGGVALPPGKYHVQIVGIRRVDRPSLALAIKYQVLASQDGQHIGAQSTEKFSLSEKAEKRLAILAHRLDLLADADFGGRKVINWAQALGRDLVVQVIEEEYVTQKGEKAKASKWGYATFWGTHDDRAAGVPRGTPARVGVRADGQQVQQGQPQAVGAGANGTAGNYDDI